MTETRIEAEGPPEGEAAQPGRMAELYERHSGAGLRLAYLLTGGDRPAAEDLPHEAFIRCVGRFRHLRVPDAFDGYLRRTIVKLFTSQLRAALVALESVGAITVQKGSLATTDGKWIPWPKWNPYAEGRGFVEPGKCFQDIPVLEVVEFLRAHTDLKGSETRIRRPDGVICVSEPFTQWGW